MRLFIQIKDGQPFEYPIFEDNFLQAFPGVDVNNLPPEFALFERVEPPALGLFETLVSEEPTFALIDGVYKDVWEIREMTAEEKQVVYQRYKDAQSKRRQAENWATWVFNENTLKYDPPIPRPAPDQTKLDARIKTFWCGADNNWKDTPPQPVDDNQYEFDFFAWQWVQVVN